MFADKTSFQLLPESGWPSITPDSMRLFGKTDEVIDLLRHLPYPSASDLDKRLELMRAMPFAAFQHDVRIATPVGPHDEDVVGLRILSKGMMYKHMPPHIVGLIVIPVNGHSVFLNTQLGIVWWHEAANEFILLTPFPVISLPDDNDDIGVIKGN